MCGKIPHGHTTVVVGQTLFVILRVLERQFVVSHAQLFVWNKRRLLFAPRMKTTRSGLSEDPENENNPIEGRVCRIADFSIQTIVAPLPSSARCVFRIHSHSPTLISVFDIHFHTQTHCSLVSLIPGLNPRCLQLRVFLHAGCHPRGCTWRVQAEGDDARDEADLPNPF